MAEKKVAAKKTAKKNEVAEVTPEVVAEEVETQVEEVVVEKPAKKAATTRSTSSGSSKKAAKPATKSNKTKLKNAEKKHSKKYREVVALVDPEKEYTVDEAVELVKKTSTTKFDSSVEIHIRLNIDPQNADQQVRGSLVLPNGTGKTKKVLAIVSNEKVKEAKDAGADFVGSEEMIEKIEKGWLDFEVVVATPDMMPKLGKIGKILGTKGLMPNPKVGTVTPNVGKVVADLKKGMVEYRVDKAGIIHLVIGRVSFTEKALAENFTTLYDTIVRVKPNGVKGTYITSISIASTMGPGIKISSK